MADNSLRTPGVGETIRTEEKGGAKTQVVIPDIGGTGAEVMWVAQAAADNTANPTTVPVLSFGLLWDGATWDRQPGNSADGTLVNLGANNDVTVTGSVSITGTVDTEFASAAALTDNFANPTAPAVGAFNMGWDGTNWDRLPGTSADGLRVDLGTNNDVTVTSGSITADTELPAAAAMADNTANPTVPGVGAFNSVWDGATWDRMPGNSTDGQLVNLGANNDVTVTSGNITADTELPAAAALSSDNVASPTAPAVGAFNYAFDGTNWDRVRGDSTDGVLVNLGANNDVTVTGTVTVDTELPAAAALTDNMANPTAPAVAAHMMVWDGSTWDRLQSVGGGTQFAEDAAHSSGDVGTMALGVTKNADGAFGGDGDYAPMQFDSNGYLKVNIKAGAGSGGTAMVDDAAFTVGATSVTPIGAMLDDSATDSVDEGDVGVLRMTADRRLLIHATAAAPANVQISDGSNTATIRNLASNDALNVALVDGSGNHITSIGGGTQFAEDAVHTTGDVGTMALAVRADTAAATAANGDYHPLLVDSTGKLHTNVGNNVTVVGTGTFAVQADTELPTAAALSSDNVASPTAPAVGAFAHAFDGTNWDRVRGDSTDGLLVNLGANNDVTVTGTVTVDTELPAAAALTADNVASPTAPAVGSFGHYFDGTNWDRIRGDSTDGLLVNLGTNNDVTVTSLPASTNTIEVVGDVAQDAAVAGNPVLMGGRASTAPPTAMSADGDSVYLWTDRSGAAVITGYVAQDAATAGNPLLVGLRAADAEPTAMSAAGDSVFAWADLRGATVTAPRPVTTATLTNVSTSTTSAQLVAATTARKGIVIVNDSAVVCYVKFGTTASSTSFTYALAAGQTLELPGAGVIYTGRIDAVLASSTGTARVTELT